jgi:cytochrome c oxidase assembly protein subunit 15
MQFSKRTTKLLKILGWVVFVAVCIQGYLGGLTVKYLLPVSISTFHSMLAQGVICLAATIAILTSKSWMETTKRTELGSVDLRKLSLWTIGAIGFQIMLGAIMRHENAGLAIPTFPLANGRLIPEFTSIGVALNFAHRVGALIASGFVLTTITVILRDRRSEKLLTGPAKFAILVLITQITLGAITILSEKAVTPATLHLSGGSLLLLTMLVISLRAHRRYAPRPTHQSTASAIESAALQSAR